MRERPQNSREILRLRLRHYLLHVCCSVRAEADFQVRLYFTVAQLFVLNLRCLVWVIGYCSIGGPPPPLLQTLLSLCALRRVGSSVRMMTHPAAQLFVWKSKMVLVDKICAFSVLAWR